MTVNPVAASAYTSGSESATAPTGKNELDEDAFLQLLIASLKYQDPSEPMSTGELMQQTTQLSMMQALTDMTSLARDQFDLQVTSSAIALVGKTITYVGTDGVTATGLAESVSVVGGTPVIHVGDVEVPIFSLVSVAAGAPTSTSPRAEPVEDPASTDDPAAGVGQPEPAAPVTSGGPAAIDQTA